MLIYTHRYWVEHGDIVPGCRCYYAVVDHNTGKLQYENDSKSACILYAQRRNGFQPVDGSELTYGIQVKDAMRDQRETKKDKPNA